LQFSKFGF